MSESWSPVGLREAAVDDGAEEGDDSTFRRVICSRKSLCLDPADDLCPDGLTSSTLRRDFLSKISDLDDDVDECDDDFASPTLRSETFSTISLLA